MGGGSVRGNGAGSGEGNGEEGLAFLSCLDGRSMQTDAHDIKANVILIMEARNNTDAIYPK